MSRLAAVARLAFGRVLRWLWIAPLAAAAALAVDPDAIGRDGLDDAALARAADGARAAGLHLWTALASALGVVGAAAWAGRLRGEAADGLLATGVPRATWALGTWLGSAGALVLALAVGAGLGLAFGARTSATHRVVGALETPALVLLADSEARSLGLDGDALGDATRLRARLAAVPDRGPVAVCSLTARRQDGDAAFARAEGRVWGRRTLEVDVPPGTGPVVVTLARLGDGAAVAIERDGLTALAPAALPLEADWSLPLRAALALVSATALVLALRPFLSTPFAASAAAALWIAAWSARAPGRATSALDLGLPGADLFSAAEQVASGVAPPLVPAGLPLALVLCAGALVVAARAPRTAREAGA